MSRAKKKLVEGAKLPRTFSDDQRQRLIDHANNLELLKASKEFCCAFGLLVFFDEKLSAAFPTKTRAELANCLERLWNAIDRIEPGSPIFEATPPLTSARGET